MVSHSSICCQRFLQHFLARGYPNGIGRVTLPVMLRTNEEFGRQVSAVVKSHSLSHAGAAIRTGVDRFTISQMMKGAVPRLEQVERFARGFGLDVNEWRELAGYEVLELVWDARLALIKAVNLKAGVQGLESVPAISEWEYESVETPEDVERTSDDIIGQALHDAAPPQLLKRVLGRAGELTYSPEWEHVSVDNFDGAERLTPRGREVANRVLRSVLTEQMRDEGRRLGED